MVVRDHPALSLSRQCRLLSVGRSSLYYEPTGESAETLALMRRIDELFLKYPFYGARRMALHLRREGVRIERRRARAADEPDGASGDLSGAAYQQSAPRAPGLPISAAGPGDRAGEPCLVSRYHLYPGAARLPLPGDDHGLGRAVTSWPGGCRTRWTRASAQTLSKRPWPGMARRRYSTPTKAASSRASPSPGAYVRPASGSRWMAGTGAWTISSSSGCGARSNTRRSISHEIADGFSARRLIRGLGPLLQP